MNTTQYLNSPPKVEKPKVTALVLKYSQEGIKALFEPVNAVEGLALIACCREYLNERERELVATLHPID